MCDFKSHKSLVYNSHLWDAQHQQYQHEQHQHVMFLNMMRKRKRKRQVVHRFSYFIIFLLLFFHLVVSFLFAGMCLAVIFPPFSSGLLNENSISSVVCVLWKYWCCWCDCRSTIGNSSMQFDYIFDGKV